MEISSSPAVSVLVTVYNREKWLPACLDSILASTFQDFEVIVVDDQSTDSSAVVAERYVQRDARIRFTKNETNLGDYPNRRRAAELARGRFLKYVDADDLIYPHSLEVMMNAMTAGGDRAGLGLSWNVIDPPLPYPLLSTPRETYMAHYLGKSHLGVGPSAAIIRREAYESVGGFGNAQFMGDTELWLKICSQWSLVSLPPALVWWRQHEGQQMSLEMKNPNVVLARLVMQESMLTNCGILSHEEQFRARARLRQHFARRIWSMALKTRRPRTAWGLARKAGLTLKETLRGLRAYD